jgi:hypothetical protein
LYQLKHYRECDDNAERNFRRIVKVFSTIAVPTGAEDLEGTYCNVFLYLASDSFVSTERERLDLAW